LGTRFLPPLPPSHRSYVVQFLYAKPLHEKNQLSFPLVHRFVQCFLLSNNVLGNLVAINMIQIKFLLHFLSWFIICIITMKSFEGTLYFYAVIGTIFVIIIYYLTYFKKPYMIPSFFGWLLAFISTNYLMW